MVSSPMSLLVDGGCDDVRGLLAGELHDVLAQVGLHNLEAFGFEGTVEVALLAHHRLRLDDLLHAGPARDLDDEAVDVRVGLGPVHLRAATRGFLLEAGEPEIEACERTVADRCGRAADVLEIVEIGDTARPAEPWHRSACRGRGP
jgi:hypothetical protein